MKKQIELSVLKNALTPLNNVIEILIHENIRANDPDIDNILQNEIKKSKDFINKVREGKI